MNKHTEQPPSIAIGYLKYFGNKSPSRKQIKKMESLLSDLLLRKYTTISVSLTEREKICLQLAAQGKSIDETSQCLGISIDTVKAYRKGIIRKLSCKNITHAVSLGIRHGYITL